MFVAGSAKRSTIPSQIIARIWPFTPRLCLERRLMRPSVLRCWETSANACSSGRSCLPAWGRLIGSRVLRLAVGYFYLLKLLIRSHNTRCYRPRSRYAVALPSRSTRPHVREIEGVLIHSALSDHNAARQNHRSKSPAAGSFFRRNEVGSDVGDQHAGDSRGPGLLQSPAGSVYRGTWSAKTANSSS